MDLLFEGKALEYWSSDEEKLSYYKQYRHLIREKNIFSIKKISEELQIPNDMVLYEIQNMIDESYILDVHIDANTDTIVQGTGPKIDSQMLENLAQYIYLKQCEFWLPSIVKWGYPQQKSLDFEKYKALIEVDKVLSVGDLAKMVNKSERDVMLEIQLMLDEAYISNIHIDAFTKIIIPSYGPRVNFMAVYALIDIEHNNFCKKNFKKSIYSFKAIMSASASRYSPDEIDINELSDNEMLRVFNQYRYLIKEENYMSIFGIEKYCNTPSSEYCNTSSSALLIIQMMIDECYLANYHIDLDRYRVVPTNGPRIDTRMCSRIISSIPDYVCFDSDEHKLDTFETYRDLIREKNITSIDEIADQVFKPVNTVMLEIQKMIDEQYLLDAHIDENTKTIILSKGPKIDVHAIIKKLLLSDAGFQNDIKCPNCGAINGFGKETCEYCGAELS